MAGVFADLRFWGPPKSRSICREGISRVRGSWQVVGDRGTGRDFPQAGTFHGVWDVFGRA